MKNIKHNHTGKVNYPWIRPVTKLTLEQEAIYAEDVLKAFIPKGVKYESIC